jgi:hypothetical protein
MEGGEVKKSTAKRRLFDDEETTTEQLIPDKPQTKGITEGMEIFLKEVFEKTNFKGNVEQLWKQIQEEYPDAEVKRNMIKNFIDREKERIKEGIADEEEEEEEKEEEPVDERGIPYLPDEKIKIPTKVSNKLKQLYYEDGYNVGRDALWRVVKEKMPNTNIPREMVQEWLKKQKIYQLFKPTRLSISTKHFAVTRPFRNMSADLIDFTNKPSGPFRYILCLIDNYSRFLFVKAITGKSPIIVAKAMKFLIDQIKKDYNKNIEFLLTDRGPEFVGSAFKKLMEEENIKRSVTIASTPQSNSIAERINKTIKPMMFKNIKAKGGSWNDYLDKAVENYNNMLQTSTGMKPKDAVKIKKTDNELKEKVKANVLKQQQKNNTIRKENRDLNKGDVVRVKLPKGAISSKTDQLWSDGLFTIEKVMRGENRATRYKLKERRPDESFAVQDLQLIKDPKNIVDSPLEEKKKARALAPKTRQVTTDDKKKKEASKKSDRVLKKKDDPNNPDNFIGKKIKKKFGKKFFKGVIESYDKKARFFKAKYEDGDTEDLNLKEVKKLLV